MAEQKKQDDKKTPDAAEPQIVKEMPAMPQAPALRMLVIETNGTRAEVRACTMQHQELLNILNDVANLVRQQAASAPPLHPAPLKIQAPPEAEAPAEAKA